jgi:hypothetical protein
MLNHQSMTVLDYASYVCTGINWLGGGVGFEIASSILSILSADNKFYEVSDYDSCMNAVFDIGYACEIVAVNTRAQCTMNSSAAMCGSTGGQNKIILQTQDGSNMTFYGGQAASIGWYQNDANIANVDILLSTDGGTSWSYNIASQIPSNNGVNTYTWTVQNINTNTAKVMILAHDAGGNCIAGVASPFDFSITPRALCPSGYYIPQYIIDPAAPCIAPPCVQIPNQYSPYFFNSTMQMCVYMATTTAPNTSCPNGGWYDSANNTCDITTESRGGYCPSGYIDLGGTYDDDTSTVTETCALPMLSSVCPNGYVYSNGLCGLNAWTPLCTGGFLAPNLGLCEATPSILNQP